MKYYLAMKQSEIITFAVKCMNPEIIILSDHRKTHITWNHLDVESKKKKKNDRNKLVHKTETNSQA